MGTQEPDSPEIDSVDQLEEYFQRGCKPRENWKIGVEYEKPVVAADTGESVPYEGERGIGRLLGEMLERYEQWRGVHEGDALIALRDGKASITLEPGGQFEMSGQQCDSLHCVNQELHQHIEEIVGVGEALGLAFLGLALVPKTPLQQIPWMPKARYRIMREIMETTGSLGHRMMKQTATVQCNFDYASESDAARKMRLAMAMSPLLVAVSANSAVLDGRATGYRSYRAHIWSDTDPARCGFTPFVLNTEHVFSAYADYALDVPMYFVARGSRLIPAEGKTFRRFLEEGHRGERATLTDWNLHLTTLFPEVRLKTYIEVRAADSQPADLMLGTPALMKGLLYDDDCLEAAWAEVARWPLDELPRLHEEASRHGLLAAVGRHTMRDYAAELCAIAREGLERAACLDGAGHDETQYIDKLQEEVAAGKTPAERVIELWEGEWNGDVDRLIEYATYRRH